MIIYNKSGIELCKAHKFTYSGTFMGETYITTTITSEQPIVFGIGAYCEYRGERFELNYIPSVEKVASTDSYGDAYKYEDVKFSFLANELSHCSFLDYVVDDNTIHYSGMPNFTFYGTVFQLAERIKANLDRVYTGDKSWTISVNPSYESAELNISATNISCMDALAFAKTSYGAHYIIRGRNITIGSDGVSVGHTFGYGIGNGLKNIKQVSNNESSIITRLRSFGSTKNLPYRWYNKQINPSTGLPYIPDSMYVPNLMLPDFLSNGGDTYIDDNSAISNFGIREGVVYFDGTDDNYKEIYPTIEGVTANQLIDAGISVTVGVGDNGNLDEIKSVVNPTDNGIIPSDGTSLPSTFTLVLKDLGFDLSEKVGDNYIYATTDGEMTVSMKSGMATGYDFSIISITKRVVSGVITFELVCNRYSDTDIGMSFPNTSYPIASGDKFVLVNIQMPDVYILAASQRLLSASTDYLSKNNYQKVSYEPELDNLFMARNPSIGYSLKEGDLFDFSDSDLYVNDTIIVKTLEIRDGDSMIPQYSIILSNEYEDSTIGKINSEITKIKVNTPTANQQNNWDLSSAYAHYHGNKSLIDLINQMNIDVLGHLSVEGGKLKSDVDFYSLGEISAFGAGDSGGSSGGGLIQTVYGYSSLGNAFNNATLTDTFNAYTINQLHTRLSQVELGAAINVSVSGTGNAVTGVSKNGNVLEFTKGVTFSLVNHTHDYIPLSQKGTANGVASLDANGLIISAQLPSYVDDVIEVSSYANLPVSGESGKIYVTTDTNITYRWTGTTYVEISKSIALGETSSTAYRGDLGAIAYAHSQIAGGTGVHVSSTERTNWNTAYTNSHIHDNKSLLDAFSQSDNDVLNHLSIVDGKLKVDIDLYSLGEVSAFGAGSGGSGSGLIQTVYGLSGLGGTYSDATLTDTFNAYAINSLYNRINSLENGSALNFTTTGSGNAVTSVTKSGNAVTVTKGLTFSVDGHTHSYLPLSGGTLTNGIEIQNTLIGTSYAYGGGGYNPYYNNIILRGSSSAGSSGILFTSSKGTTTINQTTDRAFIQYHPYGVTLSAEGSLPTIGTKGESGKLVIGVGNDDDDMVYIQSPSTTGIKHIVGTSIYTMWDSGNFTNLNQLTTRNFSDLQNIPTTLSGYGITDAYTKTQIDSFLALKLDVATFNDLFEKVNIGTELSPVYAIKAKYNFYSIGEVSAFGAGSSNNANGGLIQTVYGYSSLGNAFNNATLTDTFNAYTINQLHLRLSQVESGAAVDFTISGSGNAVTGVTKNGNVLEFTKGVTFSLANHTHDYIPLSQKGTANGVASLDANGLIISAQLPSYVDDVIEVSSYANLPVSGESGKIYVTTDTNITYRWTGTTYVEISKSLALGETSSTAYRGDLGAIAYAHSQIAGGTGVHVSSTERTNWNLAYTNNHTHTNKSVLDGITSTLIANWNIAYTNNHTHANKSLLDAFTQSDNDVLNHLSIVDGKLKVDIDLYSLGEVSAFGAGSGGSGLIQTVYGYSGLGGTYNNATLTDTFNAYTINKINTDLGARITSLEAGSALTFTTTGSGNAVTSVTKSGTSVTVTKGLAFSVDGHTHSFASLTSKPTTLSGYGITDAYTKTDVDNTFLKLDGGTLSGNLFIPNNVSITQNQDSTSNYTTTIRWYKGGVSQNTYSPQIGQHNTGGTGSGSITILPYPTSTEPWNGTVGLFLTEAIIKFNNNNIYHSGNFTNLNQLTTRNFSDLQNKPTTLGGYGITDAVTLNTTQTITGVKTFTGNVTAPTFVGSLSGNASTATRLTTLGSYDANNIIGGAAFNYVSPSYWVNAPSGMSYGLIGNIISSDSNSLSLQLASDINHDSTSSTKDLWFRTANNLGFQNDWKKIWHSGNDGSGSGLDADLLRGVAPSNLAVLSATKLANTRTIWGQSFNGEGNVSGAMSGITNITMSGALSGGTTSSFSSYSTAARFYSGYDSGAANSISCSGWFRSSGTTGWINDTYGGGINMTDSTYVRVYNNKAFWVDNNIVATGEITAFGASDIRLKSNIKPINSALDFLSKVKTYEFDWNEKAISLNPLKTKRGAGVIAQEMSLLDNNFVHSIYGDYLGVDYERFIPYLIGGVNELSKKMYDYGNRLDRAEKRVAELELEVKRLIA